MYIAWIDFYWDFYRRKNQYKIIFATSYESAREKLYHWSNFLEDRMFDLHSNGAMCLSVWYKFPLWNELQKWIGMKYMHNPRISKKW